jgi:Arc/MetJ-type ribon-helix-helix transcriptional regulator
LSLYRRNNKIRASKTVKFDIPIIEEIDELVTSRELSDFSAAVRYLVKLGLAVAKADYDYLKSPELRQEIERLKNKTEFLNIIEEWKEKNPEILKGFATMYQSGLLDPNSSMQEKISQSLR